MTLRTDREVIAYPVGDLGEHVGRARTDEDEVRPSSKLNVNVGIGARSAGGAAFSSDAMGLASMCRIGSPILFHV